jgi:Ca2+/H+ antiporter
MSNNQKAIDEKIKYKHEIKYFIKKGGNNFFLLLLKIIILICIIQLILSHAFNFNEHYYLFFNITFLCLYIFIFILFIKKHEKIILFLIEKEIDSNLDLTLRKKEEIKRCIKKHSCEKNIHILNIDKIMNELKKDILLKTSNYSN